MDTDLALILGLVMALLAVPAAISAWSDGRPPRGPALTVLIAGGLILYAVMSKPGGYSLAEVPDVFLTVVNRYMP